MPCREKVQQLLQDMLDKKIISPSKSPWASPVVLVQKKNGSVRFCIDYRKVNAVTRKDAYPLPRVDDTLDTLAGSVWFSTLDLKSGYWQVEVNPGDREKTAFCTQQGLFEFNVMPFGLCNAPATFQRLMNLVLAGIQWHSCLVYIDDIIIFGKTFDQHLHNLQQVLDRLRQAGLKLQPSKCQFLQHEVIFLGHVVSQNGVAPDPEKTSKVAQWPTPSSAKEVQQFLGLASYYRRFVKDFAAVAKPLHRLTEKGVPFVWTDQCQGCFNTLKTLLTSAPILALPNWSRPFIVDTDASDLAIGAVLAQVNEDGEEQVIAYASRCLSKAEKNYCVTRRELLAVVTFLQQFKQYLLGRPFMIRSDHGALTWLQNFKEPDGQLARWLEKLQEFQFTIVHRPGRKHNNADALSRIPCRQCGRTSHVVAGPTIIPMQESPEELPVSGVDLTDGHTTQDLRQAQLSDHCIGKILQAKEVEDKPSAEFARGQSLTYRRLHQQWDQLIVQEGVLWRHYQTPSENQSWLQLVVPQSLQAVILNELHEGAVGGHLGQDKTLHKLKERFYWPGHFNAVRDWCQTCPDCASRKSQAPRRRAPLGTITAGYPTQIMAVDLLGPLPESHSGNSYVMVVGDYFTRWMEALPIPNQEAETVAKQLVDEVFLRYSVPEQLHSDQGRQFESELVREVCKLLNIRKTRTTPYHPQCDGLVERFNRTLLDMLATCSKDHPFDWEQHIRKACIAYNTSVNQSTGFTPFYLMFGRQARLPVDIMFGTNKPEPQSPNEYAAALKKQLTTAFDIARDQMSRQHVRQKEYYDQKLHGKPYQKGDLVWLHSSVVKRGHHRKLHHPWTGPYQVLKQISDATYRIKQVDGKRQRKIVHFDRLKPCPSNIRLKNKSSETTSTEQRNDEQTSRPADEIQVKTPNVGTNLQLVDEDDDDQQTMDVHSQTEQPSSRSHSPPPRRYPDRHRQPPARYNDFIPHALVELQAETSSQRRGIV